LLPPRPLYPAKVGGLLERDREIAKIGAALTQARSGVGRCVIFEGPAGIGKTALLDVVKAMAYDNDFRVLSASGSELEIDFPFGVVRQLFAPVDLSLPTEGSGLFEALDGIFQLTSNLAESSPLLLAIDDAQWCDGASLRYLIFLQRRLGELPLAIVVATRRGEPSGDARLLDQLGLQGRLRCCIPPA
jgi:predicted ATPase